MKIIAVRSTVTGQWNYCPESALPFLQQALEYDDEPTGYLTHTAALDAARADRSIPKGATYRVLGPKPLQDKNIHDPVYGMSRVVDGGKS